MLGHGQIINEIWTYKTGRAFLVANLSCVTQAMNLVEQGEPWLSFAGMAISLASQDELELIRFIGAAEISGCYALEDSQPEILAGLNFIIACKSYNSDVEASLMSCTIIMSPLSGWKSEMLPDLHLSICSCRARTACTCIPWN